MSGEIDYSLAGLGIRRIDVHKAERGVRWLYDQFIPYDSFGVLLGETGVGKSTVAIDLAVATATATPFAGCDFNDVYVSERSDSLTQRATKPLAVLYVCGEGRASLDLRIVAAYEARRAIYARTYPDGFAYQGISELPIFLLELACTKDGPGSLKSVVANFIRQDLLMTMAEEAELPIGLIVVDTWMATVGLGNENDNVDARDRVRELKELASTFESVVIAVAHTKKDTSKMRGASSVVDLADFSLSVDKKANSDVLKLVHDKARHGPEQKAKSFRLSLISSTADEAQSLPPVIEWLDSERPASKSMPRTNLTVRGDQASLLGHVRPRQSDGGGSANEVYLEAVDIAAMGLGVLGASKIMWTTLESAREVFDSLYQRNADANRKAFERAHKRAVAEGRTVVSTAADGRQFVGFAQ